MNTNLHLTDDQLDDHLIGDLAPEPAAHLAACDLCAHRVAVAKAPIAGFQAASLAWGERRSATMPMQRFSTRELSWNQRLAWTASMAAALTVGFAVPMATHQARLDRQQAFTASTTTVASVASPDDPEAQISTDNRMLQAIDAEFDASAETPAALGLVPASTGHASSRSSSRSLSLRD